MEKSTDKWQSQSEQAIVTQGSKDHQMDRKTLFPIFNTPICQLNQSSHLHEVSAFNTHRS